VSCFFSDNSIYNINGVAKKLQHSSKSFFQKKIVVAEKEKQGVPDGLFSNQKIPILV
jgi:hypothetical protein